VLPSFSSDSVTSLNHDSTAMPPARRPFAEGGGNVEGPACKAARNESNLQAERTRMILAHSLTLF